MSKEPSQTQKKKFIDAAKSLSTDEDEAAFKAKLAVIGKQKPADAPKAPKRPRKKSA